MSRPLYGESPRKALLEVLSSRGLYTIGGKTWISRKKMEKLGFQHLSVEMLVKEYSISTEDSYSGSLVYSESYRGRRFSFVMRPGDVRADAVVTSKPAPWSVAATWRDVRDLLPNPPLPLFVVDLSLRFIHTEEEQSKLRLQIAVALGVIREYLWDPHLALTSIDSATISMLREVMGDNKVTMSQGKPSELLWSMDADRVIILRPDASQPLSFNDVLTADAFLIGGIVDKIPKPGLSKMLDNLVPWGTPKRIELRGSVVGVPDRINRLIEILLKARYKYPGDLTRSIITSMTKKDRIARAYVEIVRNASKTPSGLVVSWDLYEDLSKWLPITPKEFLEACRRAKARVVGGPRGEG